MRILIVEDEKRLAGTLQDLLRRQGYTADVCYDGISGLDNARSDIYDLLVLDAMLPGMDGFTLLRQLRGGGSRLPVLMLTARSGLEDRVRGLNTGADYYLPKPFERSELIACLNAITRRKDAPPVHSLSFGNAALNREQAALTCGETCKTVKLSAKEFQLLEFFMRNPGQVVPKETLLERVWGFENEAEYNNLSVYLTFLRRKIAFVGANIEIRASRGLGYSLEEKT